MTVAERAARLTPAEIIALLHEHDALHTRTAELQRQNDWCKRQLFGRKSERRLLPPTRNNCPCRA